MPGTGGMSTGKLWNCILTDFESATGREARPLISVDTNSLRLGRTTLDVLPHSSGHESWYGSSMEVGDPISWTSLY